MTNVLWVALRLTNKELRTQSAYKPIDLLDLLYLAHLPDHLLLLLCRERCQAWTSILWKVDTSYTIAVLANCTHPMALICNNKKWSLVVTSWLLYESQGLCTDWPLALWHWTRGEFPEGTWSLLHMLHESNRKSLHNNQGSLSKDHCTKCITSI